MRALPYFMFVAAVGAMLTYHWSVAPQLRWMAATLTPFFLGVAAIAWGVNEVRDGKALIYRAPYRASRSKQPLTFWTVILVFRFAIGAALLGAVVWRLAMA